MNDDFSKRLDISKKEAFAAKYKEEYIAEPHPLKHRDKYKIAGNAIEVIELLDNLTYFKDKMEKLGLRPKEPKNYVYINKKLKLEGSPI